MNEKKKTRYIISDMIKNVPSEEQQIITKNKFEKTFKNKLTNEIVSDKIMKSLKGDNK
jgi:hypothetical protein